MDLIEKLLYDLHSITIDYTNVNVNNGSVPKVINNDIIASIEAIVFSDLDYMEMQYIIILLFRNEQYPPSLLQFLIKTSRDTDHDIILIKKQSLKFIAFFIKVMYALISTHVSFIFHTLIQLFKVETSNDVKSCLLLPIKNILRKQSVDNNSMISIQDDFKVTFKDQKQLLSIYDTIINILHDTNKKNRGLKAEGLKVLGLLIYEYPFEEASTQCIHSILKHCKYYLDSNFAPNQKEVELSIIVACFSCLDRCFWHYEEYYQPHYQDLWRYLLQAIEAISFNDTKRFAVTGKALRLLSHHSGLFQTFLTTDAMRSYELLYNAMISGKSATEKYASNALYSILHQISNVLVQSYKNADSLEVLNTSYSSSLVNKTVMKLYGDFMLVLKEGSTGDLIHAVHGLSVLAPAIIAITLHHQSIASVNEDKDAKVTITNLVLSIIEAARYYMNDTEKKGTNETTHIKLTNASSYIMYNKMLFLTAVSSFISATSCIPLSKSDSVVTSLLIFTPKIVQFLEEYIVEAVVSYSMLWTKQQILIQRVLCKLGHALIRLQYLEENINTNIGATTIPPSNTSRNTDSSVSYCTAREVVAVYLNSLTSSLLLRAVSRRLITNATTMEPLNPETIRISEYSEEAEDRLLFAYVPLLNELLIPKDKETKALLIQYWQPDYTEYISDTLFNKLFNKVLQLLETLDLKYQCCEICDSDNASVVAKIEESLVLVPDNMADQDIFLSLVTFLEQFMSPMLHSNSKEIARFRLEFERSWSFILISKLIQLSEQYPMISGIIRLLTLCLRISGSYMNEYMNNFSSDLKDDSNVKICILLKSFMLTIQQRIITSTGNYHCELLDAVLCLLNSAPHNVLSLIELMPALQLSLRTGFQLLSTMQSLTEQLKLNKNALLPHLPQLLPLLDRYLRSNNSNDVMNLDSKDKLFLKSMAATNKLLREAPSSIQQGSNNKNEEEKSTNSTIIQNSILTFLGRLGGSNQYLLVQPHLTVQNSLAWTEKESMVVNIPLESITSDHPMCLDVCLDTLLQRLTELCSNISKLDPQLSSAASELLHALVIYMIGNAASLSDVKTPIYSSIYSKVFPVVIHLSVGSLPCNILFEKLLFQLIRWMSGINQVHEDDTAAMLDSLFACLGNSEVEGSEREICSRGVVEFFLWGIKQSTKQDLAMKTNSTVDALLNRICMMICHPNQSKRGSSITILIKLYKHLKEETSLVHRYILKVLHLLLKSMKMYPNSPFEQELVEAISKFEVAIFVHVTMQYDLAQLVVIDHTNQQQHHRDYPQDLSVLVLELLKGSLQSDYLVHRRQCMRIFTSFCPLLYNTIPDIKIKKKEIDLIVQHLDNLALQNTQKNLFISNSPQIITKLMIINTIEKVYFWIDKEFNPYQDINITANASYSLTHFIENILDWNVSINYLRRLNCCIDGYNWLVKMQYINPEVIFFKTPQNLSQEKKNSTGRKRKKEEISSDKNEEVHSEINSSDLSEESILLNCILKFIECYYLNKLSTNNDSDLDTCSNEIIAIQREILYRIIIFMCNLFESGKVSNLSTIITDIWYSAHFHQLIIRELLCNDTLFTSKFDLFYAVRRLYTNLISLSNIVLIDISNLKEILTREHNRYVTMFQQIPFSNNLSTTTNIIPITLNLQKYHEFYKLLRDTRILPEIFQENEVLQHRKLAKWLLYQFVSMFSCNSSITPKNNNDMLSRISATKSNKNQLILIELGAVMIDLSITLGLKLVSGTSNTNNNINNELLYINNNASEDVLYLELLECLNNSSESQGSFLLEHYGDLLITHFLAMPNITTETETFVTSFTTSKHITLFKKENLKIFLEYAFVAFSGRKQVLKQLFARILSTLLIRLSDQSSDISFINYISEILLPKCGQLFNSFPDDIVTLLLEICSYLRKLSVKSDSNIMKDNDLYELEKQVYDSCISIFEQKKPEFIKQLLINNNNIDSEMNILIDVIIVRLNWLPYVIPSITKSAYSPIGNIASEWTKANFKKLLSALEELVALRFPLDSKKLPLSTEIGRNYTKLFNSYLSNLKQCGSVSMLSALLPSLREGDVHVYYDAIKSTLHSIANDINVEHPGQQSQLFQSYTAVHELCKFCFEQIFDIYQDLSVKHILFHSLLKHVLRNSSSMILIEIFSSLSYFQDNLHKVTVIKYLCDILTKDINVIYLKSGYEDAERLIDMQSFAYNIIEILYDNCDVSILKSKITEAFTNDPSKTNTGNELTLALIKVAYKQLRPDNNSSYLKMPLKTTSKLYSSAFCCLGIVIAKTQEKEGNFDKFIFQEKPNEDVWKRVLSYSLFDENEKILNSNIFNVQSGNFVMTILGSSSSDSREQKSQHITRQRQRDRLQNILGSMPSLTSSQGGSGSGMSYLSQYITGSIIENSSITKLNQGRKHSNAISTIYSLSNNNNNNNPSEYVEYESSQYDSNTIPTTNQIDIHQQQHSDQSKHLIEVVPGFDDQLTYLEMNDINQHPAMGICIRVIQRITKLRELQGVIPNEAVLPTWLSECKTKLDNITDANNANVRLFILRLLMNKPISDIILPWMQSLLTSILKCALYDLCDLSRAAQSLNKQPLCYNYVLKDLVFVLCYDWKDIKPDNNCQQEASKLVSFLLKHSYFVDSQVTKDHIYSIQMLSSLWFDTIRNNDFPLEISPVIELLTVSHQPTGGAYAVATSLGTENVQKRQAGLALLRILFVYNYPLLEIRYSNTCCTTQILDAVINCMMFPRKEVMEKSCELVGIILDRISEYHHTNKSYLLIPECEKLRKRVEVTIDQKINIKDGSDSIATCLRAISFKFPSFVSREMLMKTSHFISILKPRAKYDYLDMLCRSTSNLGDAASSSAAPVKILDILEPYLISFLVDLFTIAYGKGKSATRLPVIQINTLILLRKHLSDLAGNFDMLEKILGSSKSEGLIFCTSEQSAIQVRDASYKLLIDLWNALSVRIDVRRQYQQRFQNLKRKICQLLINGLKDRDTVGMNENQIVVDDSKEYNISYYKYDVAKYWNDVNSGRKGIRRHIFDFFETEDSLYGYGLSLNPSHRLKSLMTELFDASQLSSSSQWLQYSSFLLLSLSRRNSKYNTTMFQRSLSDSSSYKEIDMKELSSSSSRSSSTKQLSAMTPIFFLDKTYDLITKLNTQKSSSASYISDSNLLTSQNFHPFTQSSDISNREGGFVRGTQQVAWTQLDYPTNHVDRGDTSSTQYVLMGKQNITTQLTPVRFSRNMSNTYTSTNENIASVMDTSELPSSDTLIEPDSKRTAQSTVLSKAAKFAKLSAIQGNFTLQKKRIPKKKVVFYRKYREGELPDINISLSDILQPLQSLCILDDSIAGILFGLLYNGIYQSTCNQEAVSPPSLAMSQDLQQMLQSIRTNSSTSILVSTLLRCNSSSIKVAMKGLLSLPTPQSKSARISNNQTNKQTIYERFSMLLIPADIIVECAVQSNNFHSGIEALEQQLLLIHSDKDLVRRNTSAPKQQIIFSSINNKKIDDSDIEIPTQVIDEDMLTIDEMVESRIDQTHTTTTNTTNSEISRKQKLSEIDNGTYSVVHSANNCEEIWRQLYRLYDKLGQTDVLLGLTARLSTDGNSKNNQAQRTSIRLALDAEMDGNYTEAVRIYSELNQLNDELIMRNANNTTTDNFIIPCQAERDLWDERTLLCLHKLCDWEQLHECVDKVTRLRLMDAQKPNIQYASLPRLLSELDLGNEMENKAKEQLIPHYLYSILHLSCPYKGYNYTTNTSIKELKEFIDSLLVNANTLDTAEQHRQRELKQWLERNYPMELAIVFAIFEQWAKARLYCDQAHRLFVNHWSTIHPCAYQARKKLLLQLQPILEIRDTCEYYSTSGNTDYIALSKLMFKWENSTPFLIDEVNQWATISQCRTTGLNRFLHPHNPNTILSSSQHYSTEDQTMAIKAKLLLSSIHIKTAAAAVFQKTLGAVKPQLEISNYLLNSVPDTAKINSLMEVNVVYNYNAKIISQQDTNSYQNKCVPIFESILGLLDHKLFNTTTNSTNTINNDTANSEQSFMNILQLKMLRADWLVKWSECEREYTRSNVISFNNVTMNSDTGDEITIAALDAYVDCDHMIEEDTQTYKQQQQQQHYSRLTSSSIKSNHSVMLHKLRTKLSTNFTMHCDNLFQKILNDETDLIDKFQKSPSIKKYTTESSTHIDTAAALVASCYVKGLKLGNNYCIQRVLRLVQLIGCYKSTEEILLNQLQTIPSWVFLQYAASMMGCLDRPEGAVIASVLEYTAKQYSTAMYYSYHITSEFLGEIGRTRSAKLEKLLRNANPHQEAFIEALTCLTHPEQRWNDGIKELFTIVTKIEADGTTGILMAETTNKQRIQDKNISMLDKQNILHAYNCIRNTTLNLNWRFIGSKIGVHNIRWAKSAKPLADAIVGTNGEKILACKSFTDIKKLFEKLKTVAINAGAGHGAFNLDRGYVGLNQFSQWLAEFDPLVYQIEVPGQYSMSQTGDGPPNLIHHEKIIGFDPTILVMPSVRKPKRIKLYGSAGTQFIFLVKGGEDLRNDERIQQLFKLMNHVIQSKLESSEIILDEESGATMNGTNEIYNRLCARTYIVVPMSSQMGILEWVSNTTPLESIIKEEILKDSAFCAINKNAIVNKNEVVLDRLHAFSFNLKALKDQGNYLAYHNMYKKSNREEVVDLYHKRLSELPNNLIRRRFLSMAVNAETFLTIRSEFAYKLAINNLYGYILGIGDRHLGNILIDKLTGGVILIDFGVCFDIGSSILAVPELIPFRLTTELRSVLQPLDATGLLRHYMTFCMKILREDAATGNNSNSSNSSFDRIVSASHQSGGVGGGRFESQCRGVVPNALEIYVNDPVLDWVKGTSKHLIPMENNSNSSNNKNTSTATSSATSTTDASFNTREEWDQLRENLDWEPRRRVYTTVQKLLGVDPVYLLHKELSKNPHVIKQNSLAALTNIITSSSSLDCNNNNNNNNNNNSNNDNENDNIELNGEGEIVSVDEQIDKLINLATDPNILMRQWTGLMTCL